MLKGKVIRFGDDISTDLLIAGRYMYLRSNLVELAKHACEDIDPNFVNKVQKGDFVVGGRNFGLGSSREQAAIVLKMNGVAAVIAKSFGRIFFRNAINIGLPVIVTDTEKIRNDDELEIDLSAGTIHHCTTNDTLTFGKLPPAMLKILAEGGLIPYVKKYGDFQL